MAGKICSEVGYVVQQETEPGVWEQTIVKRKHYGELVRNSSKFQTAEGVNDNINISTEISIVADAFANENFYNMRYIEFMGVKWKITNVEVQYPRLILSLGGLYTDGQ